MSKHSSKLGEKLTSKLLAKLRSKLVSDLVQDLIRKPPRGQSLLRTLYGRIVVPAIPDHYI
ncbi:MAG: hypothetical protein NTX53_01895 [candidate division WOR-3 bacterium]|nr:hypothetical protein [candidate division WOR-3 bacterium]